MRSAAGHYRLRVAGWAIAPLLPLLLAACAAPVARAPLPVAVHPRPQQPIPGANEVLIRALGLVGTPYRWGGNTPEGGFDCSGLVHFVFLDSVGLSLPRTAQQMSEWPAPRIGREALQSGDLLFFGRGREVGHVGIYVGEGRFVHAPNDGGTVRLDRVDGPYWGEHYLFARRPLAAP